MNKMTDEKLCNIFLLCSFIYIIDGEVEYTIDDKLFNLKKGQTITIHAGSIHSMEVKEKAKIMVVWFKTD